MCREEAQSLSSLLPDMEARGVRLYGVVHETLGAEDFKTFFKGEVFYDPKHVFYGPQERWCSLTGILNIKTIMRVVESIRNETPGNLQGEGRLLGGVFVIGPGEQGVVFQHHEKVYGDYADLALVKDALLKVNKSQ